MPVLVNNFDTMGYRRSEIFVFVQEIFTANDVTYVKVQIMLVEKIKLKRETVNYEAVKFINWSITTHRNSKSKEKYMDYSVTAIHTSLS